MKLAINERLNSTLEQLEMKFNEEWRLSLVEQILKRNCSGDEKKAKKPVIRKAWLNMIPKEAHPPFEFAVVE